MNALRSSCRIALVALAVLATGVVAPLVSTAQEGPLAPTYSRARQGAEQWRHRGDYGHWNGGGGYGYGFYQPFYNQPIVAGTYYERPYPYHFDYYRHRWGGGQGGPPMEYTPELQDCPCDVAPALAP